MAMTSVELSAQGWKSALARAAVPIVIVLQKQIRGQLRS